MEPTRRLAPLPLKNVTVSGPFWGPRLETNRRHTLRAILEQLERVGVVDALDASKPPAPMPFWRNADGVTPVMFWDSDLAKWIEAVAYSLESRPDTQLEAQADEIIARLVALQQPDGYLDSFFIVREPQGKFVNERDWHEMYCAGHLLEAAVAYFQATGKRVLLDALIRYVDLLATVYGPGPGQKRGYPGHEELELALVKLWRLSGEERFLNFARYLVEERGRQPVYFDQEARERGVDPETFTQKTYEYMQAHRPVREHDVVVGHAVRATYL
ncbi:MAG TPA: beta-L-arabinofuranosidase domain-containing protein, partial [Deinococcales bacterium]|nr:beta-L-arabinofuranosidase domain-containing protein [Deinococcales bacterium]